MRMVGAGAVFVLLIGASSPGLAAPKKGEPGWDPDRQICKSKPVVGSRLKKIRECATAQQWEDMRQQERNGLLRRQFNGSPGCRGCDGSQDSPI